MDAERICRQTKGQLPRGHTGGKCTSCETPLTLGAEEAVGIRGVGAELLGCVVFLRDRGKTKWSPWS